MRGGEDAYSIPFMRQFKMWNSTDTSALHGLVPRVVRHEFRFPDGQVPPLALGVQPWRAVRTVLTSVFCFVRSLLFVPKYGLSRCFSTVICKASVVRNILWSQVCRIWDVRPIFSILSGGQSENRQNMAAETIKNTLNATIILSKYLIGLPYPKFSFFTYLTILLQM
jgi:hypothetical protein